MGDMAGPSLCPPPSLANRVRTKQGPTEMWPLFCARTVLGRHANRGEVTSKRSSGALPPALIVRSRVHRGRVCARPRVPSHVHNPYASHRSGTAHALSCMCTIKAGKLCSHKCGSIGSQYNIIMTKYSNRHYALIVVVGATCPGGRLYNIIPNIKHLLVFVRRRLTFLRHSSTTFLRTIKHKHKGSKRRHAATQALA